MHTGALVRVRIDARKMRRSLAVKYRTLPEIERGAYDREKSPKDPQARTHARVIFAQHIRVYGILSEYVNEKHAAKTRGCNVNEEDK